MTRLQLVSPVCPECDGAGRIPDPFDLRPAADAVPCPVCNDNAPPARELADVGHLVRMIEEKIASVADEEAAATTEYGRGVYRGSNLTLQWVLSLIHEYTDPPADLADRYEQLETESV